MHTNYIAAFEDLPIKQEKHFYKKLELNYYIIIPAATVSNVPGSIKINAPVVLLRR
jgi:hypothetical protein